MNPIRSRTLRGALVALAAGSLVLTGCSSGSDSGDKRESSAKDKEAAKAQSAAVEYGDAAASKGPAKPVEGAQEGGTIRVYQEDDFSHLDPGQIYVSDAGQLAGLIHRGLTTYTQAEDGSLTVVGDLATDSGKQSDGGKTWTYTLKDGIKDQEGDPITSKDIRHTIERLYAKHITDGPTYIQQWLSGGPGYRDALPDGPYEGDHLPDSVLETPDEKTIVFHFETAQPDLPQALAMPGYSIVPEEDDTKAKYDQKPVALGPYKIDEFKPGKSMKLVKNTEWDPKTDPARHQYVDGWNITFNHSRADQSERILADRGESANAIQMSGSVDSSKIKQVIEEADKRTIKGYQPYVWQLNMNMDRLKDKKVRDAITYALPNAQILRPDGGSYAGEPAGGLLAPTLPGYEEGYDPYGKLDKPNGDIEKAKQLLKEAGKEGMKLTYAYANVPHRAEQAVIIENALEKAGFDVQKKDIDQATWYEQVGKVKNGLDIYMTGWGQDWPSASTVIPPVYDGDQIADGASNYSHINDKHVNSEIDRISKIQDPEEATKEWVELHKYIVEEVNPAAPLYYTKQLQIYGSNVGGARYSTVKSYIDLTQLYLKK
ncbi:ABC transporter substrate-binding protein [Streptomyces chitinivorans]|uniref:ABC transporter substrate-binding protein n=1 Tax=Streptomyces chitinivorans TaxID=1257027 RepID=A0ABW7HUV4_9ACTN|nr:ABC transporter substrate-binding protein [Streptomyces chitinivorans]MDH2410404.1 ABC transporter substrate-binding protein [Streptomyces chitinivorans]